MVKRCAACGKENPVSEMKVCMHQQMHRYVCDSKCMTDFYNQPKKPTAAELEAKVAALEAENAKLRAELERRVPDGLPELLDMLVVSDLRKLRYAGAWRKEVHSRAVALRDALAAAPSAPKADDPVKVQLLEALEHMKSVLFKYDFNRIDGEEITDNALRVINAAIAAARKEGGKPESCPHNEGVHQGLGKPDICRDCGEEL